MLTSRLSTKLDALRNTVQVAEVVYDDKDATSFAAIRFAIDAVEEAIASRDAVPIDDGTFELGGKKLMLDDRGNYVPIEAVKPQQKIEDEMVRKIFGYAEALSGQVGRFFGHTMTDLSSFDDMLAQEYQLARGGAKGNRTYRSFDGLRKIQVQVADRIVFGPELEIAKGKIDEWLLTQIEDSSAELRAFVMRAFDVDKKGTVNQAELLRLRHLEITDPVWIEAMRAITDAIRPLGTKQYIRFYRRASKDAAWEAVTIDLAQV